MSDALFEATYERLRRLASAIGGGESLGATDVVHEVYLKLRGREWSSASHFRATAASAMRSIVIDRARARVAQKRGGDLRRVTLSGVAASGDPVDLLELHVALERLEAVDPDLGRVVELKLFGGLEVAEIARDLEVSESTAKRRWRTARAWLASELEG